MLCQIHLSFFENDSSYRVVSSGNQIAISYFYFEERYSYFFSEKDGKFFQNRLNNYTEINEPLHFIL